MKTRAELLVELMEALKVVGTAEFNRTEAVMPTGSKGADVLGPHITSMLREMYAIGFASGGAQALMAIIEGKVEFYGVVIPLTQDAQEQN